MLTRPKQDRELNARDAEAEYERQVDIVVKVLCVDLDGPISTLLDCHEAEELQELTRSSVREEAQVEARRRNSH